MKKILPYSCPACSSPMNIKVFMCPQCATEVSGEFKPPTLMHLSTEDRKFILDFVKCSGRLKEMSKKLKLSYPTVRNLLDDIIEKIKLNGEGEE